jgi:hypothetical protein
LKPTVPQRNFKWGFHYNCYTGVRERMNMVGAGSSHPPVAPCHLSTDISSKPRIQRERDRAPVDGMKARVQVTADGSDGRHAESRHLIDRGMKENMCSFFLLSLVNYMRNLANLSF